MQVKGNRWLIFAAAWWINLFTAATAIYSAFSLPMTSLHQWSLSGFNLGYSIYLIVFCVTGIFAGRLCDKYGPVKIIYIGSTLFGLGWIGCGFATDLWMLYLCYGFIASAGGGAVYNAVISSALRWFPDKGGSVSGMILSAAALGPAIMMPIARWLIDEYGPNNTFMIIGVAHIVGIWTVGWLITKVPDNYRPAGWQPSAEAAQKAMGTDYNWRQMFTMPVFYLLFVAFVFATTSGNMVLSSASPIAQSQIKMTPGVAAYTVTVMTLANFFGRLSFGVIFDKIGDYKALALSLVLNGVAMLLMSTATTAATFFAYIGLLGFSFGGLLAVFAPIVKKTFGSKNFGMNFGIMFTGYSGGALIGSQVAAYYKQQVGTFTSAYYIAAVLALVALMLLFFVAKIQSDRKAAAAV